MTRLFILLFALNAFITPASAMGDCEMMDGSSSGIMVLSMPDAMPDMDCDMGAEVACSSADCASSCSTGTVSQLISEKQTFFIVAGRGQPLADFAYFYRIILSINTPPPLV